METYLIIVMLVLKKNIGKNENNHFRVPSEKPYVFTWRNITGRSVSYS